MVKNKAVIKISHGLLPLKKYLYRRQFLHQHYMTLLEENVLLKLLKL